MHGDRHKIAEPVGRRATEAIKAHEMQMVLYVRGWGLGRRVRSLLVLLPSACYHHQWKNLWVLVICSFNNFLPQLEKKEGDGAGRAEDVQLAKIRFRLAGQITRRSDLLHFSAGINTLACSHASIRTYASHVQCYTHTHSRFHPYTILAYAPSKLTLIQGVLLAQPVHKSLRMSGG